MDIYILIALIAVCAFLPRCLPWVVWAEKPLPPKVENILSMTPAAVIAALVAPAVVFVEKEVSLSLLTHPYFLSSVVTFAIMLITKRLILSSTLGMFFFLLLNLFVSST